MGLFGKKAPKVPKPVTEQDAGIDIPELDPGMLRRNSVVLLTIDERWTSLFTGRTLPQPLEAMQNAMNETLKREATIRQELEQLEPAKRKAMGQIIRLTKEAFEDGDARAKEALKASRDEIERINLRWSALMEEMDGIGDTLREANLALLRETVVQVFKAMRTAQARIPDLDAEIRDTDTKLVALRKERDTLAVDWSRLSEPFTKLFGPEYVQQLETQFAADIQASMRLIAPAPAPVPVPVPAAVPVDAPAAKEEAP